MNRTASFRRSLTTSLAKAAVLIAAILAFVIPMAIGGAFDADPMGTGDEVMEIRPHAANSPAGLIERHDCWTGEAPADMAGKFPGHAVITLPAGMTVYSTNLVDLALEQTFEGVDHGIRVHAFCR